MKLSIIIPIYNTDKYLDECLSSITKNVDDLNYELEVILVNDGSTDKSEEICLNYKKKYKYIKYFYKKNEGVSVARNLGIEKSTGDYIMFVDSDDKLLDGWQKKIYYELEKKPNKECYYFNVTIKNNEISNKELTYMIVGINNEIKGMAAPWSKIYSRKIIEKFEIKFNSNLINGEDMLFNIEFAINSTDFSFSEEMIYEYRNNPFSATHKFDKRIFKSDICFHNELSKTLKNKDINDKLITNHCLSSAIFALAQRISQINNYKEAKKYFKILSDEPYKKCNYASLTFNKKIINIMIKFKLYIVAYIIFKIKEMIK